MFIFIAGDPQETNNQKQADICSEVSDIILTGSRNQAPFTSKSTDTYPASEKTNESEKVCLTTVSKVVKGKYFDSYQVWNVHYKHEYNLKGQNIFVLGMGGLNIFSEKSLQWLTLRIVVESKPFGMTFWTIALHIFGIVCNVIILQSVIPSGLE